MKKNLDVIIGLITAFLIVAGISLAFRGLAEAKYKPSPATLEMSKDIKDAQSFVRDHEQQILEAKEKATVYRQTICRIEKEACTKEYLDPLNAGTDLTAFLAPAAK